MNVIITDTNVERLVLPAFRRKFLEWSTLPVIDIPAGERYKNLEMAARIWERMINLGMGRADTLICLGGGMVTDIGGFCASTFKRGIAHINVCTTLLGAADACIGGKTGIDFAGIKNSIGTFAMPSKVIIMESAFESLPYSEILSGFGEMLKTALLESDNSWREMLAAVPCEGETDCAEAGRLARNCARFKEKTVEADPHEHGLRRILNLGHTFGHAFESRLLEKDETRPHGWCVAHGLLCALILSHIKLGLDSALLYQMADVLKSHYRDFPIDCADFDRVRELMDSDKKNISGRQPRFVLLKKPGEPVADIEVSDSEIREAFDLRADILGI